MKTSKFKIEQEIYVLNVLYRKGVDVYSSDKKTIDALRGCPHTKEVEDKKTIAAVPNFAPENKDDK